ncbi:helix-turn-helix domain-containing protein [Micrococcus sp. RIT608]|uniref:helix-turn-helix domain-containing protein n=1 Tax=Micrococcus sp. RIT608 TaxID=2487139 RepID=UPI00351A8B90
MFLEGKAVAAAAPKPRPSFDPRPRLTIAEVADYTGTSPSSVRRWIARGELRAYKYGPRAIRIDPADVDAMRQPVTSLADLRGGDVQ